MAEEGRFRLDLLHRLSTQRVRLPPLRQRREDIPAPVARACKAHSTNVDLSVMEQWLLAPWPGKLRQLNNEVSRLAIRARHQGRLSVPRPGDEPIVIPGLPAIAKFVGGGASYRAEDELRKVDCWGGRLQRPSVTKLGVFPLEAGQPLVRAKPAIVPLPSDIVDLQSGTHSSCALRATGEVLCWGSSRFGELPRFETGTVTPILMPRK
jgi:hypothetical protein